MNAENLMKKSKDWIVNVVATRKLAVIYVADEYGKAMLDNLVAVVKGTETKTVEILSTDVGQTDYTGELVRVQNSGADALYIIQRCDEISRILVQSAKLGINKRARIIGTETLIGPDTIRLAGEAAEGAAATSDLTYKDPTMWPMAVAYKMRFGQFPGHDAIKQYLTVMVAATATESVGAFDQQGIKDFLHNRTLCAKDYRWLPVDVHYDENGILDRESYELMVKNGDQVVNQVLKPVHPEYFKECKE
jgi:branched-chain amino acid transport system substrate-binding protein